MNAGVAKRGRAWIAAGLLSVPPAALTAAAEAPSGELTPAESVRAAELAFAAAARNRDREAFASLIAEDAIFVDVGTRNGKPAILEAWAGVFQDGGVEIDWSPEIVEMQEGDQIGLTRGSFSSTHRGEDGQPIVSSGVFTSVWRREPTGEWKVIFDIGCPPCAAPQTPVATGPDPDGVDLKLLVAAGTLNHRLLSYELCSPRGCSLESFLQWFKTEWDPEADAEREMPNRLILATCPLPELTGEVRVLRADWKTGGGDPELSVLVSPPTRDPEDHELLISPGKPCDYTVRRGPSEE